MKKILLIILSLYLSVFNCVSAQDFEEPVPDYNDEVTSAGPDTKFSLATQMRFDAFQNAEVTVPVGFLEDKMTVKIYKLSKNGNYLQKVRIPNAKVAEYTNGSYDIKFKDIKDTYFKYDKDGELQNFVVIKNNGKVPFYSYYYDTNGNIAEIEIKPDRYRSYIYDLKGTLTKYVIDDKTYAVNGKMILRKKTSF